MTRTELIIVASGGSEELGILWEHVSIHAEKKIAGKIRQMVPTWAEMCFVKSLFWDAQDCVMQLHPPEKNYVNDHPFTLHMWRPTDIEIPMPPEICV